MSTDAEAKDFWKSCYIAAVVAGRPHPREVADQALQDYLSALEYLETEE